MLKYTYYITSHKVMFFRAFGCPPKPPTAERSLPFRVPETASAAGAPLNHGVPLSTGTAVGPMTLNALPPNRGSPQKDHPTPSTRLLESHSNNDNPLCGNRSPLGALSPPRPSGVLVLVCPLRSMCRVPKLEFGPIAPVEASGGGGQRSQHPKPSPAPEANRDPRENIQIQHAGEMQRPHNSIFLSQQTKHINTMLVKWTEI